MIGSISMQAMRAGGALEHVLELVGVVRLHEMREAAQADRHAFAVGIRPSARRPAFHLSIGVNHMAASNRPW